LTAQGERLLDSAKRMSEWAGELNRAAEQRDSKPRGVVRVTAPPGVAFDFLTPFAAAVTRRYPELSFQILSSVEYLDLARGEADLALRFRPPTHRDLVSIAYLRHENAAFASPAYVARLPRKYGLADVGWIAWAPPMDKVTPNPELAAMLPGFKPVFAADDFLVQIKAAECGVGAMFLGRVRHRFSSSKLVALKVDMGPHKHSQLHLVCAKSSLAIPRVRMVADLLKAELDQIAAG
jgi:DNA-binding transcriptional LysR family regulator